MGYVRVSEVQRLAIEDMAAGLADGQEGQVDVCPMCNGGSSMERSFSVRRQGAKLLFICHRDSCKAKGIFSSGLAGPVQFIKERKGRQFEDDIQELPFNIRSMMMTKWNITHSEREQYPIRWSALQDRILIPVCDRHKKQHGWVARAISPNQKPKTLNYISEGETLAWFTTGRTSTEALLIVEDAISAIRSSTYVDSVALLGTNLSLDKLKNFTELSYKTIWLALDKDAIYSATRIVQENRMFLPNIKLLPLDTDIKDQSRIELENLLAKSGVVQ